MPAALEIFPWQPLNDSKKWPESHPHAGALAGALGFGELGSRRETWNRSTPPIWGTHFSTCNRQSAGSSLPMSAGGKQAPRIKKHRDTGEKESLIRSRTEPVCRPETQEGWALSQLLRFTAYLPSLYPRDAVNARMIHLLNRMRRETRGGSRERPY